MTNAAGSQRRDAVQAVRALLGAYDGHDVERMLELCRADARVRYVPMGEQGEGWVRETGRELWSGLIDAFPDLHVTVESAAGDERHAVAEAVLGGTQERHYLQVPNQGERYELPHAFLVETDGEGLITEIAAYWDNASFYSQLGKATSG
ncbi:MAG TPA: nuclear transport factor 2 family protein [Gaiellaceae bacterium]|jgi:steroid delta-isomerase-like uncharacterized protein|nr:nuclear transport factor 2 family protein [Gaiellaceae bacterium]